MQRSTLPHILFLVVLTFASPQRIFAQERSFASILPNSVVAYVEFESADQLLDHPLRKRIQQSPEFLEIWRSPDVMQFRGGMKLAEVALGDKVESIARKLTQGGLAIAVDREHNAVALISRSESKAWLDEYLNRLVELTINDAKSKNNDNPVKQANYRGMSAYQANGAVTVALGEYLVVVNKGEFGKAIVDCYLDQPTEVLENQTRFAAAVALRPEPSESLFAWGFADLTSLREAGFAKKVLSEKSDNFAAELLLGGLLETLHDASTITATWSLDAGGTKLSLAAPHDPTSVSEERGFFFGPDSKGTALPLLQSTNTLASLSAYRDVSQLWLRAGDLFNSNVNDELAQAESTLTTLFSGRDFAEDILGAMQPEVRIVVERQEFDGSQPTPALRLPSFALVAQLRNPEVMQKELKRTFQSLIGFLNVAGAMNGQPQLDLGMESNGSQQFFTAQYEPEVDRDRSSEAPIQFNFSPSLAFVNGEAILSSTIPLAQRLANQLSDATSKGTTTSDADTQFASNHIGSNTLLEIDAQALRESLVDNRKQLIAQNILEKGHSQEEAEAEIDTLLSLLNLLDRFRVQLAFEQQATLDLDLRLAN
jgi:hypothetical protein